MAVKTCRFSGLVPQPWVNGAGTTTELVSFEESVRLSPSGTLPWRLSVARLEAPGEFSAIPLVRRTFTPIGGAVQMLINDVTRLVSGGESVEFLGDDKVVVEDLSHPCFAINLMVRSDEQGLSPRIRFVGAVPQDALVVQAVADGADFKRFDLVSAAQASAALASVPDARFSVVVR